MRVLSTFVFAKETSKANLLILLSTSGSAPRLCHAPLVQTDSICHTSSLKFTLVCGYLYGHKPKDSFYHSMSLSHFCKSKGLKLKSLARDLSRGTLPNDWEETCYHQTFCLFCFVDVGGGGFVCVCVVSVVLGQGEEIYNLLAAVSFHLCVGSHAEQRLPEQYYWRMVPLVCLSPTCHCSTATLSGSRCWLLPHTVFRFPSHRDHDLPGCMNQDGAVSAAFEFRRISFNYLR